MDQRREESKREKENEADIIILDISHSLRFFFNCIFQPNFIGSKAHVAESCKEPRPSSPK